MNHVLPVLRLLENTPRRSRLALALRRGRYHAGDALPLHRDNQRTLVPKRSNPRRRRGARAGADPPAASRAPFLTDRPLPLPFIALSRAAAVSGASPASWYR